MSNSIGNLNVSIFGDSALLQLGQIFPAVGAYSTNISTLTTPYGEGSSITVKTFSTAGTTDYTSNGGYVNTAATSSDTVVTLNKHKVAQRSLSIAELSSPYASIMLAELGKEMGQSLGEQINKDFFSLITAANFPNYTIVNSASFSRNQLNNVRSALSKRGVAQDGRSVVLNNDYYAYLGNDQSYVSGLALNPNFSNIISTGTLPQIAGFQPYEVGNSLLPSAAYSSSYSVVGIAGQKSGIAFATRPVPTFPADYSSAQYSISANEKLGLAITNTMVFDPITTGNMILRSELVYGFNTGSSGSLQVLIG